MNRLASLVTFASIAALSACQTANNAPSPTDSAAPSPAATPVASGPARVDAAAAPGAGCPGQNQGPAFIIGSRGLASASEAIGLGQATSETLVVPAQGGDLSTGGRLRSTSIGSAFELCVITSPPARGAALSGIVSGQLQQSRFASAAETSFWQNFFQTYFLTPLQLTPTDAGGVLRIDVLATNLQSALAAAPSASGEMLITVTLADGAHQLNLTVEKR